MKLFFCPALNPTTKTHSILPLEYNETIKLHVICKVEWRRRCDAMLCICITPPWQPINDPCTPYVVVFVRINNLMYFFFLRFFSLRSHDPCSLGILFYLLVHHHMQCITKRNSDYQLPASSSRVVGKNTPARTERSDWMRTVSWIFSFLLRQEIFSRSGRYKYGVEILVRHHYTFYLWPVRVVLEK